MGFDLRESSRDSVLAGLNLTNHLSAQFVIFKRSAFNVLAEAIGSSTTIKSPVSSANKRIFELISATMSLIYIKKEEDPI